MSKCTREFLCHGLFGLLDHETEMPDESGTCQTGERINSKIMVKISGYGLCRYIHIITIP